MKLLRLILSSILLSLCSTLVAQNVTLSAIGDPPVEKASVLLHAPTRTTLSATSGTLGQPVTFTATVRTFAAAGAPQGTIYLFDRTNIVGQFDVSPTNSL